jgi:hypothetical protein
MLWEAPLVMHVLSMAHGFQKSHQLNKMDNYLHRAWSVDNHTPEKKRI